MSRYSLLTSRSERGVPAGSIKWCFGFFDLACRGLSTWPMSEVGANGGGELMLHRRIILAEVMPTAAIERVASPVPLPCYGVELNLEDPTCQACPHQAGCTQ